MTEEKSLNELSSTLIISEMFGYYSGQYYCIIENEAGKVTSKVANLRIQTSKVITCALLLMYNHINDIYIYIYTSA